MPYQPRATLDNPYGPQVTFRTEDVLPPSALYLSADDTLVLLFQTNTAGSLPVAYARLLMPDGEIRIQQFQSPPLQALPTYNFLTISPTECYLLSMMVNANLAQQGSVWCQCWAIRGTFTPPYTPPPPYGGMLVLQGYLDDFGFLAWPNSPIVEPGTGAGRMRSIRIANVTGVNFKFTVPSLTRWEILSCQMVLTTTAAGANRIVELVTFDQTNTEVCGYPCTQTTAPSTTFLYFFFQGAAQSQTLPTLNTAPLPSGLMLDSAWSLQSNVTNLAAGDTITNLTLHVREWVGIGTP